MVDGSSAIIAVGARAHGSLNVNDATISCACQFPMPPTLAEQQKIADCLTSLDELIAARGRKAGGAAGPQERADAAALPPRRRNPPRLRFPEFRDAPEWEEAQLGERLSSIDDGRASAERSKCSERVHRMDDDVAIDMTRRHRELRCDHRRRQSNLGDGDILARTLSLATGAEISCTIDVDKSALASRSLSADLSTRKCMRIRPISVLQQLSDGLYERDRVSTYSDRHGSNVSDDLRMQLRISIPPKLAEQQRIADCLSSLDALIAAQVAKARRASRPTRRACMQQLFPSPEEV